MTSRKRLSQAVGLVLIGLTRQAWAQYEAPNAIYGPGTYYDTITGTGATLKANLNAKIDGHTLRDYATAAGDAALLKLEEDPNNTSNVLLVYNGVSIAKTLVLNTNYNREHLWCNSYGISDDNRAYSDLFNLRICDMNVNSDRNNDYYDNVSPHNAGTVANPEAPECYESADTIWEPRPIEKGDLARSMFYMDTRYSGDGNDDFANDLMLTDDTGLINSTDGPIGYMGKLDTLLHWHYQDGVSNAERRRNQFIYTSDTSAAWWNGTARNQGNRNPFIDHPEWVWTIFGGANNNSKIYVGGTPAADGSSNATATLRVMKNGTFGTASVGITKTGSTPTTYDITIGGSATTTAEGPGQAFDYSTQSRSIPVGLSASTATTGLKTGTVTINNTDLTTAATGQGSADGNDTITVNGSVVDNRVITATQADFGRVIIGGTATANTTLDSAGDDNNNTRVTVKAASSAADSNGISITTGVDRTFNGMLITATRTLSGAFSSAGPKSGFRSFTMQGEGLAGEVVGGLSVNYVGTANDHSNATFDSASDANSKTIDFGYVKIGAAQRSAAFQIYNRVNTASYTAALDIDGASRTGSTLMNTNVVATPSGSPLAAGPTPLNYNATFDTAGGVVGLVTATHTITSSDENITGAINGLNLALTTNARLFNAATFPVTGFIDLPISETLSTGAFSIQSNVTLTKTGAGTMNIDAAQTNGATSQLTVSGGTVNMSTDAGSAGSQPLAVSVDSSALNFSATQHLRSLNLGNNSNVTVNQNGSRVIVANSLTASATGKMDLKDNRVVVRGGTLGSWDNINSRYTGLSQLVDLGRGSNGEWNGNGLVTSMTSAINPSKLTTLAIAAASDIGRAGTTWSGQTINAGDVLVMYTWGGDANLSGAIDGDDYFRIDHNINKSGTVFGYENGDFNYDGLINGDDYFIIDLNVVNQGPPLAVGDSFEPFGAAISGITPIPEPASVGLLTGGVCAFLLRRRRR